MSHNFYLKVYVVWMIMSYEHIMSCRYIYVVQHIMSFWEIMSFNNVCRLRIFVA